MYEKRLGRLLLVFAVFLTLIGVQAFRLQVLRAGNHVRALDGRLRRRTVLMPRRGDILARDGTPLASNAPGFAVHVNLEEFDSERFVCESCGHRHHTKPAKPPRPDACSGCGRAKGFVPWIGPVDPPRPGRDVFLPPRTAHWVCRKCPARTAVDVPLPEPPGACDACGRTGEMRRLRRPSPEDLAALFRREPRVILRAVYRVRRQHRSRLASGRGRYKLYLLLSRVSREAGKTVATHADRYPGIAVRPVPGRVVEPSVRELVGLTQPPDETHTARMVDPARRTQGKYVYTLSEAYRTLVGVKGLEHWFDEELRGVPGVAYRVRKDRRSYEDALDVVDPVVDGAPVRTTIRLEVQALAHDIVQSAPSDAAAVVLDLADGAVVAIDSSSGDGYHHAVTRVQPGSVFKLVTALAFLQTDGDPGEMLHCANAGYLRRGFRFHCANHPAGELDLEGAFAKSCNYFFMRRAEHAGSDGMIDALRRLGLAKSPRLWLKGSTAGLEYSPGEGGKFVWQDLANIGYGQGKASATPLMIAVAYGRLATEGRLVEPYLVCPADGSGRPEPAVDPVIARFAPRLKRAARLVVTEGTGRRQKILAQVRAAGKSGTAEVPRKPGDPGQGRYVNNAWFVGYAPFDAPRYVAVVVKERVLTHGAEECGDEVGMLLREALREVGGADD